MIWWWWMIDNKINNGSAHVSQINSTSSNLSKQNSRANWNTCMVGSSIHSISRRGIQSNFQYIQPVDDDDPMLLRVNLLTTGVRTQTETRVQNKFFHQRQKVDQIHHLSERKPRSFNDCVSFRHGFISQKKSHFVKTKYNFVKLIN